MSITDLLLDTPKKQDFYGVTVGIVTNIDDPDKLGRVKVKLINRGSSNDETDFIRVCSPMVGKKWGMFFFPEVGDEVLVAFSNGEIIRPYVIGCLWNQSYAPPVEIKDGKNMLRKIKTKNGHELIFNDEDDKNSIEIKTPNKRSIKLDDEKELTIITDKNGSNLLKIDSKNGIVTIQAEKKINIQSGNSKITLDGQGNSVVIESEQSLKITSAQITIEAKGTLDLKSSNLLNVNANGPANIKGAIVKLN